jgi:hypothetical protein
MQAIVNGVTTAITLGSGNSWAIKFSIEQMYLHHNIYVLVKNQR